MVVLPLNVEGVLAVTDFRHAVECIRNCLCFLDVPDHEMRIVADLVKLFRRPGFDDPLGTKLAKARSEPSDLISIEVRFDRHKLERTSCRRSASHFPDQSVDSTVHAVGILEPRAEKVAVYQNLLFRCSYLVARDNAGAKVIKVDPECRRFGAMDRHGFAASIILDPFILPLQCISPVIRIPS